jgi:hypothetical protein
MAVAFRAPLLLKLTAVLAAALSAHAASALTLSTLGPNNGSGGTFFDLSASATGNVSVTGFASYFGGATGAAASVEVWTRAGSYVGTESSTTGWTLLGTISGTAAGTTTLSAPMSLTTPIAIGAGSTVGIYLHSITAGNGLRYQGTGTTATSTFSNGDLTLTGGHARTGNVSFAGTLFSPRVFSGDILYSVTPVPEPATYGLMALGLLGVALRHRQQRRIGA